MVDTFLDIIHEYHENNPLYDIKIIPEYFNMQVKILVAKNFMPWEGKSDTCIMLIYYLA